MRWNKKDIEKTIDKMQIPKTYRQRFVNLDNFLNNDYTMQLSIRQDSGKTTQALLLGLALNSLYGTHTIYMRSDKAQITLSNIENLYNVIIDCGYVEKLYKKYNTIVYKPMQHKFFLGKKETAENGECKTTCSDILICHVVCLENWKQYKSNVNDPYADYILFDEFMDTSRSTSRQMNELQDNISTFGRLRENAHCLMLGNNVNRYCFWFEEFCIENDIINLDYGTYIERKTELGTTFVCELLRISEEQKEKIEKRKIRFSGFNTPKMSAYNGLTAWQGGSHPHIPDNDLLNNDKILDNVWIKHRNAYVRINVYNDDDYGDFLFLHYSKPPKKSDCIILSINPSGYNEFYGLGELAPSHIKKPIAIIFDLIKSNRAFYSTNSVGELVTNYLQEHRANKRGLL